MHVSANGLGNSCGYWFCHVSTVIRRRLADKREIWTTTRRRRSDV